MIINMCLKVSDECLFEIYNSLMIVENYSNATTLKVHSTQN